MNKQLCLNTIDGLSEKILCYKSLKKSIKLKYKKQIKEIDVEIEELEREIKYNKGIIKL